MSKPRCSWFCHLGFCCLFAVTAAAGEPGPPPLRDPNLSVEGVINLSALRSLWTKIAPGSAWTDPALSMWQSHLRSQLSLAACTDPVLNAAWAFVNESGGAVGMVGPQGGVGAAFQLDPARAAYLTGLMPGNDLLIGAYRGRGRGVLGAVSKDDVVAVGPTTILKDWLSRAGTNPEDPSQPLWLRADLTSHQRLLDGWQHRDKVERLFAGLLQRGLRLEASAELTNKSWSGRLDMIGLTGQELVPLGHLAGLPKDGLLVFAAAGLTGPAVSHLLEEWLPKTVPDGGMAVAVRLQDGEAVYAVLVPMGTAPVTPTKAPGRTLAGQGAVTVAGPDGQWTLQHRGGYLLAGNDLTTLETWARWIDKPPTMSANATAAIFAQVDSAQMYKAFQPWLRLTVKGPVLGRNPAGMSAHLLPSLSGFTDPESATQAVNLGVAPEPIAASLPLLRRCVGRERLPGRVCLASTINNEMATIVRLPDGWSVIINAPRDGSLLPAPIDHAALTTLFAHQPHIAAAALTLPILTIPPQPRIDSTWLPDPAALAKHLPIWTLIGTLSGPGPASGSSTRLTLKEHGAPILTTAAAILAFQTGFHASPLPPTTKPAVRSGTGEEF